MALLDTSPEIELRQVQIWRSMSGEQRLRLGFELSLLTRELAMTGIRERHPEWSEQQVKREAVRCAFLPQDPPGWLR